jgi:GTPase SAR1 family protein
MNGSDTESPFKFPLNILLLGERGVGKTSFLNAYLGYPVADDYIPTIGLDTTEKDHLLPGN